MIVFRARGYRFDLNRGVFVYSGTINIKSNPQDITVTLNGEINDSKKLDRINNSFNLSGLIPDDYEITVSAPGFQSWRKKTPVHSGLASEFWNVVLVRESYEKTTYNIKNSEKFFISPDNSLIALSQKENDSFSVGIFNIKNNSLENSFSFPDYQLIPDSKEENIEWSPVKNTYLSIPLEKKTTDDNDNKDDKETNYFIANLNTRESFSLNEFLGIDSLRNVRWDPQNKNYLFFLNNKNLYRANIQDKNDLFLISDDVSAFDVSQDAIFYAQFSNKMIHKSALDGKSDKIQITNSLPDGLENEITKLIIYDRDRMVFLDQKKNLFIFNQGEHSVYFRKIGENISDMRFSDDGKKLLFWTDNEISVYFVRDWTVQPFRNENETKNITRYIEKIKNVQWWSDYEHIIFNVGNYSKIIELDSRDHRNCMDLIQTESQSPFLVYDAYLEKLFFTDRTENQWGFYSIDFPEKTTLLGF